MQRLADLPLRLLSVQRLRDSEKLGSALPRMSSTIRSLTLYDLPGTSDLSSVAELQELEELTLTLGGNIRSLKHVGQL